MERSNQVSLYLLFDSYDLISLIYEYDLFCQSQDSFATGSTFSREIRLHRYRITAGRQRFLLDSPTELMTPRVLCLEQGASFLPKDF